MNLNLTKYKTVIISDYTLAIVFFCLSVYFFRLFSSFRFTEKSDNKQVIAKIDSYQNNVSLKQYNSTLFREVVENEKLGLNDTLFVSESSTASIIFIKTKNRITLSQKTLIRIEEIDGLDKIELIDGNIELHLNDKKNIVIKNDTETINIQSPTKDGSTLSISKDKRERLSIKPLFGRLIINRDGANNILQVSPSVKRKEIAEPPPVFILPPHEKDLVLPIGGELNIKWVSKKSGSNNLTIIRSGEVIVSTNRVESFYNLEDPYDGKYTLKISNGIKGDSIDFNLSHRGDLHFTNAINDYNKIEDGPILIKWNNLSNAEYVVSVIDNEGKVVIKDTTRYNYFSFLPINKGIYKINVSLIMYPYINITSAPFSVNRKIVQWRDVKDREIISQSARYNLAEDFIILSGDEGILSVTSGKEDLRNGKLTDGNASIDILKNGLYCFKVLPKFRDKNLYDSSEKCTRVSFPPPFDDKLPTSNLVLKRRYLNKQEDYILELPAIKNAIKYEISIFRNNYDLSPVLKKYSDGPMVRLDVRQEGIFYFTYRTFDKDNRSSNESAKRKLIFPISPFANWDTNE
jgi:hypothetical protein